MSYTADYTRTTTIDQHQGTHATGMPIRALHTITTRASDLFGELSSDLLGELVLDDYARDVVDRYHVAAVALASLDSDARAQAEAALPESDDLETLIDAMERGGQAQHTTGEHKMIATFGLPGSSQFLWTRVREAAANEAE